MLFAPNVEIGNDVLPLIDLKIERNNYRKWHDILTLHRAHDLWTFVIFLGHTDSPISVSRVFDTDRFVRRKHMHRSFVYRTIWMRRETRRRNQVYLWSRAVVLILTASRRLTSLFRRSNAFVNVTSQTRHLRSSCTALVWWTRQTIYSIW